MMLRKRMQITNAGDNDAISLEGIEIFDDEQSRELRDMMGIRESARRTSNREIEPSEELFQQHQVDNAIDALPAEERQVAEALRDHSIREAAALLRTSKQRICAVNPRPHQGDLHRNHQGKSNGKYQNLETIFMFRIRGPWQCHRRDMWLTAADSRTGATGRSPDAAVGHEAAHVGPCRVGCADAAKYRQAKEGYFYE